MPLINVEEFEVLLEREEVFGTIVAGQGSDDPALGRVTPIVPMSGELLRVSLTGHEVAEDPHAGHAGDVADHQWELHVHLDQRFLHALHEGAGALDERRAVPEIAPQGDDAVGGAEAPAQEPQRVEVAQPFTVGHVALAAREILDVPCIDEDDVEPMVSRIPKMGIQ